MMFAVFCPTHNSRVLMTRRNTIGFWNGPDGPVLRWRCECGQQGLLDRHGDCADAAITEPPSARCTTATETPDRGREGSYELTL